MYRLEESEVYKWYDIFKNNNQLTEIRLIGNDGRTASGYFTDVKTMIEAIRPYTDSYNVYFTINALDPACYGRVQKDKIVLKPKNTTSDSEIIGRDWVFIDLDSKRIAGTNATDEQVEYTKKKANEVYKFLKEQGFYEPVVVFSSNGVHLYLKCALRTTPENNEIIKRFIQALGMLFSDDKVEIDLKIFNTGRISRLPGSYSCKGSSNDPKMPQRLCKIIKVPAEIKNNDIEYFKKVASIIPEPEVPSKENNYRVEKFDLQAFLDRHGIKVKAMENVAGGKKYVLEHCLFNDQHKGKDAVIFQRDTGEIAYHCFHSSCAQYKWKDVRLMFEPDAYNKRDYQEFRHKQMYYGLRQPQPITSIKSQEETEEKGKKWLSMSDIEYVDIAKLAAIPTGYLELDKKIMGLLLGDLTIVSGISGAGKTSWLDCIVLNAVQRGYKTAVWSGELQDFRFQSWIDQIAAGKNYTVKKTGFDNLYYAPRNVCDRINEWLDGKLFLYNNRYGNRWAEIFSDIKDVVEKNDVKLVCLDNLMSLQIEDYGGEVNTQQTKFINDIKDYAKLKNIHIILVCHPRKESQFLRAESISGTGNILNLCDNCFILHRVGRDFEMRAGEFLGKDKVMGFMQFSTVIEVCKNRAAGVKDELVGLYYEPESRRLKNELSENIIYGWQDEPKDITMDLQPNEDFDDLPPDDFPI